MEDVKFEVGQEVYITYRYSRSSPRTATVESIGRKYITAGRTRFNKVTWEEENGNYSPMCSIWPSKEYYETYMANRARMYELRTSLKKTIDNMGLEELERLDEHIKVN